MLDIVEGTKVERTKEPENHEDSDTTLTERWIRRTKRQVLNALERGDMDALRYAREVLLTHKLDLVKQKLAQLEALRNKAF